MPCAQLFRFVAVIVLVLLLVAACGSDDPPAGQHDDPPTATIPVDTSGLTPTPSQSPGTATSEPAPMSTETAGATSTPTEPAVSLCDRQGWVPGGDATPSAQHSGDTTRRLAASYAAIDGIDALAWASYWVVQARIVEQCSEADSMNEAVYVVEVERTFRGEVREFIRVRGIVDRYSSGPGPAVGAEMMLFLSAPDGSGGASTSWAVGGPQGVWPIRNGLARSDFSSLALTPEEFATAIATALSGDPPQGLPFPAVALDVSPPGPDLPSLGSGQLAGCGGELLAKAQQGRETLRLLWSSQHVFGGTVIGQLPSFRLDGPSPEADPILQPVVTDYLVQIEEPIRGQPDDIIRVRRLGGEVDGCVVTNAEGQLLEVGQRALMFVWTPEPDADDPTYYLNGSRDGFWRFEDDGALVVQGGNDYRAMTVVPAQQFVDGLRAALDGSPLEHDGSGLAPVSLDDAPFAAPLPWPQHEPDPATVWVAMQDVSYGVTLDIPEGWTVHNSGEAGVLSLANFPTVGGNWESIPDGGIRIDIDPSGGLGYGSNTPLRIGRGGYTGAIYFSGLLGDTYHVYISYEIAGQTWHIAGYFKEPADLANPNTRIFLTIVGSILHGAITSGVDSEGEAVAHGRGLAMSLLGATDPR